jgi:hypothetical protein
MTPIYILVAKMIVKMLHMSLKYIHLLHSSTSLGHIQVTFFFQGIYRTAHMVTHTLKYAVVYLFLVSPQDTSKHTILYSKQYMHFTIGRSTHTLHRKIFKQEQLH